MPVRVGQEVQEVLREELTMAREKQWHQEFDDATAANNFKTANDPSIATLQVYNTKFVRTPAPVAQSVYNQLAVSAHLFEYALHHP